MGERYIKITPIEGYEGLPYAPAGTIHRVIERFDSGQVKCAMPKAHRPERGEWFVVCPSLFVFVDLEVEALRKAIETHDAADKQPVSVVSPGELADLRIDITNAARALMAKVE